MDRGRDPACIPAPQQTQTAECHKQTSSARGGRGWRWPSVPSQATSRKWRQRQARACPGVRTRMSALGVRMRRWEWTCAPQPAPARAQSRRGPGVLGPGLVLRLPTHRRSRAAPRTRPSLPMPLAGCAPAAAARPGHVTTRGRAALTWVPRNMASAPQDSSRDHRTLQGRGRGH